MTYQIEIKIHFRAGHRLMEPYKGKCNNPHGEGYTAILIFENDKLDENGMVLDFGTIKKDIKYIIDKNYDHSFMFNKKDKLVSTFELYNYKIYLMDNNPTAENIAKDLFSRVRILYPELKKVGIIESFDDSIAWYEEDLKKSLDFSSWNKAKIGQDFMNQVVKIFSNNDLEFGPGFKETEIKKCEICSKDIPSGFSEFCLFHYSKKRFFCSKKCLIDFTDKYKEEKNENQ